MPQDYYDLPLAPSQRQAAAAYTDTELPQPITGNAGVDSALRTTGDVLMGAFKQPGRLVQMVPGVAALTDKVYGLPPGASKDSMQPTNTAQKVGGYFADALETLASFGADVPGVPAAAAGLKVTPKTIGGKFVAEPLTAMGEGFVAAAKKSIFGGGPITATKVGAAVEYFGEKAVKMALYGAGAGALWEAWKKL